MKEACFASQNFKNKPNLSYHSNYVIEAVNECYIVNIKAITYFVLNRPYEKIMWIKSFKLCGLLNKIERVAFFCFKFRGTQTHSINMWEKKMLRHLF